jgi:hypothetical protein
MFVCPGQIAWSRSFSPARLGRGPWEMTGVSLVCGFWTGGAGPRRYPERCAAISSSQARKLIKSGPSRGRLAGRATMVLVSHWWGPLQWIADYEASKRYPDRTPRLSDPFAHRRGIDE